MQVEVIARHMALSADQTNHVDAEAAKLGKYFDGVNVMKITFEKVHDDLKAEIVCMVSGGGTLIAVERGKTVHESLEFASDNMARQLKKYKEKLHRHRPPRTGEGAAEAESEPEPETKTP